MLGIEYGKAFTFYLTSVGYALCDFFYKKSYSSSPISSSVLQNRREFLPLVSCHSSSVKE